MVLSYASASSYPTACNVLVREKFCLAFQKNILFFFTVAIKFLLLKSPMSVAYFSSSLASYKFFDFAIQFFFHFSGNQIKFTGGENYTSVGLITTHTHVVQ